VNHQFDKSLAFERAAAAYCRKYLGPSAADADDRAAWVAVVPPESEGQTAAPARASGGGGGGGGGEGSGGSGGDGGSGVGGGGGVHYFSALQPLWEVQIAWLFCRRLRIPVADGISRPTLIPSPRPALTDPSPGSSAAQASVAAASVGDPLASLNPFLGLFISCNELQDLSHW
jgi:hypothetical protein